MILPNLTAEMLIALSSVTFIASSQKIRWSDSEINPERSFLKHFRTHTLLRQWKRIFVSLASPQTFGEGGGSGSGLASPPAHGGGFREHYQLDEMLAAERKEERLASNHEIAIHPQELLIKTKAEFLLLLLHAGALCQDK